MLTRCGSLLVLLAVSGASSPGSAQPAFPGAIGFGAAATGGRGGRVIHVTTLAASGPGSLAAAAAESGARYIVFDVSGVVEGDVEISSGDVTLAGQTAPGAGITIHGHLYTPYGAAIENVIVRHVRVRPPPPGGEWPAAQHDAIQMSDVRRAYFDHVDVSHGVDELVDHWNGATDVTWDSSIFSFPNPSGGHPDGSHPYCLIAHDGDRGSGGGRVSILGNLFSQCRVRTPALSIGPAEAVDNVVYGGREGFVHHNVARGDFVIAGNTYVAGPTVALAPFWFDAENDPAPTDYFLGDNRVIDPGTFEGLVGDPWTTPGFAEEYTFAPDHIEPDQFHPSSEAPAFSGAHAPYVRLSADDAYERILDCAGAWPRDHVSRQAVTDARDRSGMIRLLPLGDLLEGLTSEAPPEDGDGDGMPDAWEDEHGLDSSVDDHGALLDGWPALEVYLEERAGQLSPCGGAILVRADGATPAPQDGGAPRTEADSGPSHDAGSEPHPVSEAGGCGCRVGRGASGGVISLLLLGMLTILRRRSRQTRAAS